MATNKSDKRFYAIFWGIAIFTSLFWLNANKHQFLRSPYVIILKNAGGLDKGSEVWVNGPVHGEVLNSQVIDDEYVLLNVKIEDRVELTSTAYATVRSMGMVGQRVLDVQLREGGTRLKANDTLRGFYEEGPVHLVVYVQKFYDELLEGVEVLNSSYSQSLADKENASKLSEINIKMQKTLKKIKSMSTKYKIEIPNTVDQGVKTLVRLGVESSRINENLNEFKSDFKEIQVELKDLNQHLNKALIPLENSFEKIAQGEGSLGKMTKDQVFLSEWKAFNVRIDSLATVFNRGEIEINADIF